MIGMVCSLLRYHHVIENDGPLGHCGPAQRSHPSFLIDIEGNAFDDVAGNRASPAIVEAGRPRIGVAGKVLDVFQGRVLLDGASRST